MYLTIDVGNSNIVNIVYSEDRKPVIKDRLITVREEDDQYYDKAYNELKYVLKDRVNMIILSCVVPKITDFLIDKLKKIFSCPVVKINVELSGLKINLENPDEIGGDFLAGAVAVIAKYDEPVIIIDMGTASKISVVERPDRFIGGVIQPGIKQMANILHSNISHLPEIRLEVPGSYMGHDTIECIQVGILHGSFLSLISLAQEIEKELGRKCRIILTGGYINLYKDLKGYEFIPDLINEGLLEIGIREKKNGKN